MSDSSKPLTAIVERLIEKRKAGELPEPAKRKPRAKTVKVTLVPRLDNSVPAKRTLH